MISLDIPTLSTAELEGVKSTLLNFVLRVGGTGTDKMLEEVKVLPAMTEILLRFTD